jgi:hypothetical protein
MAGLSMDKPNKQWIVVPPTNNVCICIVCYNAKLLLILCFHKKSWMALMICVFFCSCNTSYILQYLFNGITLCEWFEPKNL